MATTSHIIMSAQSVQLGLGAQMGNFAALHAIARKTGHRVAFLDNWTGGREPPLCEPFAPLPLDMLEAARLTREQAGATLFELDTRVVVDARVFEFDPDLNYYVNGLCLSYRYWYPAREEIFRLFRFKAPIADAAAARVGALRRAGRELVAIHVRRGERLTSGAHVQLPADYYAAALARFDAGRHDFLVFSDDLAWCRQAFAGRANFFYSEGQSRAVDLCAMSLCEHHIIANSAFGMWGALLAAHPRQSVVCPSRYLREDSAFPYFNDAWFPDEWIAIADPAA